MKDCLGNTVTNFVRKTFTDGLLKNTPEDKALSKWMEINVFSLITGTNKKAVKVFQGEELYERVNMRGKDKIILESKTVNKHIGWNITEVVQ